MLALVMCLLVLGVASVVVLQDETLRSPDKRATAPPRSRRARPARRPLVARPAIPPVRPPSPRRPARPTHRLRAALVLLLTTVGVGVVTGLLVGLLVVLLGLALRSIGGSGT